MNGAESRTCRSRHVAPCPRDEGSPIAPEQAVEWCSGYALLRRLPFRGIGRFARFGGALRSFASLSAKCCRISSRRKTPGLNGARSRGCTSVAPGANGRSFCAAPRSHKGAAHAGLAAFSDVALVSLLSAHAHRTRLLPWWEHARRSGCESSAGAPSSSSGRSIAMQRRRFACGSRRWRRRLGKGRRTSAQRSVRLISSLTTGSSSTSRATRTGSLSR